MRLLTVIVTLSLVISGAFAFINSFPLVSGEVSMSPVPVQIRTNTNVKEGLSMAVSDSGRIYVSWSERVIDNTDAYFSYSSNNGTTFAPAARINNNTLGIQRVGGIGVSGENLYFAWEDGSADGGDIMLSRSADGGMTFGETHVSDTEAGTQSHPTIAASGSRLAVAWEEFRSDNTIRIWRGTDGALIREISGHTGAVRDVEFSQNGTYLASGSEDSTVKIWSAATGSLFRNITSHTSSVTALNWSANGNMLATGSDDHDVVIHSTTTLAQTARLNSVNGLPTRNYVNALCFSPNSQYLAVAYNGRYGTGVPSGTPSQHFNITVWSLAGYSNWTRSEFTPDPDKGHTMSVTDIAFSHNGTYLATCGKDSTLKIWNPVTGQKIRDVYMTQWIHSVAWSPGDTHVAAGLGNGSIAIVNISNTADIRWMTGMHTGRVNSIDWSKSGAEIISGASDPKAKIWYNDASPYSGVERKNLTGHLNSVYAVDWSSNELSVVTAGGISSQYGMGENQIFCAVSNDRGLTFSAPVMVSDSCSGNRLRPKADMNSSGAISLTWYDSRKGDQDIYFTNSSSGAAFTRNAAVASDFGEDVIPDVFLDDSGVTHIVWQYGTGAGIRYANSSDGFASPKIMATVAQMPHVSGCPDGSSLWVTWRQQDQTTKVNYTRAAVSYDGGAAFPDSVILNLSRSFVGEHAIHVDRFNQSFFTWEINETPNENLYHITTVLTDVWGPRVLSTVPANGDTDVSIFTAFTFRFSEPMDRDSAEAAFSWTDGTTTWLVGDCQGNQAVWNTYGDRASFTPRTPLQYQKSGYVVRINTSAADLAGNALLSSFSFSFSTSADIDPPAIEYYPSQDTVSYDQEYNVMAVVTDQWGTVSSVELKYTSLSGVNHSVEMVLTYTDTYLAAIPAQLALGTVYYYIEAADSYFNIARNPANYTNRSQLHSVDVVDGVKPEIMHVQVMEATVFRDIDVWAAVTDGIELRNVSLHYRAIGSNSYVRVPMLANATGNTFTSVIPAQNNTGQIQYNITATDASGNFNSTGTLSIQIIDLTAPLINSVIPEYLDNQTKVLVRANVTDDVVVETVYLYFKAVGGNQWVNRTMTNVGGDYYEFTIPAQSRSGTIYYYVNATDRYGNTASTLSEQNQFEIDVIGVGSDYTLYYILGAVLAVMLLVLAYLVVRKFGGPAEKTESEPDITQPAESSPEKADDES